MTLQLKNLVIHDRENKALFNPISFEVGDGEVFTLMGPSGCGKSSLLSTIAGHLSDDFKYSGNILYVENRGAVTRAADQIEDIKLIIQM